jgi:hypothetical protein
MSDWWAEPYKGGPMAIPAAYFPRPLYAPDSAPTRKPSKDGPDILAYKRTLSRLGRWMPWDPAKWDDSFSNAFSHGKAGGNVKDSGIAGFQRQMKIDPTGFVGEKTFNTLASCRVPEGLPHAGEMGMDANACNLIGEAFKIYGGKAEPPPPKPSETTRQRALEGALDWLGYHEAGSNDSHFGRWYGMNYQPWCAMAVCHWFEIEGSGSPSFTRSASYSYCPYVLHDAQAGRYGLSITNDPIPGDVVLFDWGFDGVPDHIGIFIDGSVSSFESVEGNTSPDSGGSQSNGGEVCRKHRRSSEAKLTFVRVKE